MDSRSPKSTFRLFHLHLPVIDNQSRQLLLSQKNLLIHKITTLKDIIECKKQADLHGTEAYYNPHHAQSDTRDLTALTEPVAYYESEKAAYEKRLIEIEKIVQDDQEAAASLKR